jgi:galactose mutarotase-like enzyme
VNIPYRFERTISIQENAPTLSVIYTVQNLSDYAIPFIWCAHPTFSVKPGMQLCIPPQEMTVFSSIDDRFGKLGDKQSWPELVGKDEKFDLSQLPERDTGFAVKLYGASPACGKISLADPQSGDNLTFSFDPARVTHFGLWLNFNGWSGLGEGKTYYNIAIEPAIGAQDDLNLAYKRFAEYGEVQARDAVSWGLNVTLSGEKMNESSKHEDEMCVELEEMPDGRILTYYHFRKATDIQESPESEAHDAEAK